MGMPIPSYKDIADLLKKGATLEAQEKIMELREAVLELREDNSALRQRIQELEEKLQISEELRFDGSTYWRHGDEEIKGPYCPRCYDVEGNLVRLQDFGEVWYCHECRANPEKLTQ